MTSRQNNIFKAIVRAYQTARTYTDNKKKLEIGFHNYLNAANADILTSIEEIATLFFLGMFYYGDG